MPSSICVLDLRSGWSKPVSTQPVDSVMQSLIVTNVEVDKIKKAGGFARLYRVADCAHARCNNQVCATEFLPRNQSWDPYCGRTKSNKARPKNNCSVISKEQSESQFSKFQHTRNRQTSADVSVISRRKSRLKLDFGCGLSTRRHFIRSSCLGILTSTGLLSSLPISPN